MPITPGLRPVGCDVFDEDRVGLDHVSFMVSPTAELEAAATLLDHLGIAHGGIKNLLLLTTDAHSS